MREFTGKHMAAVMVGGFGIVMAVNFTMAAFATGGFGGVVVENSYVASQKYNDWLAQAERQKATGWDATIARREDGSVLVTTANAPAHVTLHALARRPLGQREVRQIGFERVSPTELLSTQPLAAGRWTLRLTLSDGTRERVIEAAIP